MPEFICLETPSGHVKTAVAEMAAVKARYMEKGIDEATIHVMTGGDVAASIYEGCDFLDINKEAVSNEVGGIVASAAGF